MLTLAIPTTTRYDLLEGLVESACRSTLKPDVICVLDQRNGVPPIKRLSLVSVCGVTGITVHWLVPSRQIALAAAWNVFLGKYPDWLVIANDDVVLHEDTLGSLVGAAQRTAHGLIFVSGQDPTNEFSLFLQRKSSEDLVGLYDEAFYPIYFEDNDYRRRVELAGYQVVRVADCTYEHVGSATLKAKTPDEQRRHWESFDRLKAYYVSKWGGEPGHERYTVPFNGQEAAAA